MKRVNKNNGTRHHRSSRRNAASGFRTASVRGAAHLKTCRKPLFSFAFLSFFRSFQKKRGVSRENDETTQEEKYVNMNNTSIKKGSGCQAVPKNDGVGGGI